MKEKLITLKKEYNINNNKLIFENNIRKYKFQSIKKYIKLKDINKEKIKKNFIRSIKNYYTDK